MNHDMRSTNSTTVKAGKFQGSIESLPPAQRRLG
jgi:hypothetical protein